MHPHVLGESVFFARFNTTFNGVSPSPQVNNNIGWFIQMERCVFSMSAFPKDLTVGRGYRAFARRKESNNPFNYVVGHFDAYYASKFHFL